MGSDTTSGGNKKIMVALQGGGSHTAYAWGVMDELFATEDFEIVAIGGTSGGALIAAVVASALSMERSSAGELLDDSGRRQLARDMSARMQSYCAFRTRPSWISTARISQGWGR